MHQSAEFILLGLTNQAAVGVPRYWASEPRSLSRLTGAGVIAMTIWARKKPPSAQDVSMLG